MNRDQVVLLGAGASADSGVPCGADLHTELARNHALYGAIASAFSSKSGAVGDIERWASVLTDLATLDEDASSAADLAFLVGSERPSASGPLYANSTFRKLLRGERPAKRAQREMDSIVKALIPLMSVAKTLKEDPSLAEAACEKLSYLLPLMEIQRGSTIATLNYDTTLEAVSALNGVLFRRGDEGVKFVGIPVEEPDAVRLLKLHGSIDWALHNEAVTVPIEGSDYTPAIIFGSGNKLRYFGPYLDLLHAFRVRLGEVDSLITLGYGYRDFHINYLIERWAASPSADGGGRSLYVGTGPDGGLPVEVERWHVSYEHLVVTELRGNAKDVVGRVVDLTRSDSPVGSGESTVAVAVEEDLS